MGGRVSPETEKKQ